MKKKTEQPALIPTEHYEPAILNVKLKDLPPDSELAGPQPVRAFIEDVERFGLLYPIVLCTPPNGTKSKKPYRVADGRNRIKTARILKMDDIPAFIYPEEWSLAEVITLRANEQRRANPAGELYAILSLVERGYTMDQIVHAVRLPKTTIKKRMRLKGLIPELLTAFYAGKMNSAVAEKVSGLAPSKQKKLAAVLIAKQAENKDRRVTLTASDVGEVTRVGTVDAGKALAGLLEQVPASTERPKDPKEELKALISRALGMVPECDYRHNVISKLNEVLHWIDAVDEAKPKRKHTRKVKTEPGEESQKCQ